MNLRIEDARGQCYDGAATMSGQRTGVATQFKLLNRKMLFTHCYGHALNLAIKDMCFQVDCLKDAFETCHEICKLVNKSPQRNTKLSQLRTESNNQMKSVHAFCPTRWTVRGEALSSMLTNHQELLDLWEWSLSVLKDTEMKARIIGVQAVMKTFSFFFGCCLGELLLRQTDNLSKALQDPRLSAAEGQVLAENVIETIRKDRTDERFEIFWQSLIKRKEALPDVEEPMLPRKRKMPKRFEDADTHHFPSMPEDHYRKIYFQAVDHVLNGIQTRFDQGDLKTYINLQELIVLSFNGKDVTEIFENSFSTYRDDLDEFSLRTQLKLLPSIAKESGYTVGRVGFSDAMEILRALDRSKHILLSEVITLAKLVIVAPATNAVSERSFSALKRLKTYLRATMADSRLNHLMILHVHKEMTDKIDLKKAVNDFIAYKDIRKQAFGLFADTE